jgi:signal transduction histidine kinase
MLQAALYANDEAQRQLRLAGGYALGPDTPRSVGWGTSLLGQVAKTRRTVVWDAQRHAFQSNAPAALLGIAPAAVAILPLVYNAHLAGVLEVSLLQPADDSTRARLETLAASIAASLQNIRSQLQVQHLFEQAEEANRQLRQREQDLELKVQELEHLRLALEKAQDELLRNNQNLEFEVRERTAELEATLESLQSTQHQLVLSEKMAALGQLVAGVAHEINSPIGAIKGSVGVMQDIMPVLVGAVPRLVQELPPATYALFQQLVNELWHAPTEFSTPAEARKRKRALTEELEAAGVGEYARDYAARLVEAGLRGSVQPYTQLLLHPLAADMVQTAYQLGQLRVNLENIHLATDKTKKVVYALKSYAHSADTEAAQPLDLRENVDTVLTIYQNQLKHGIDLQVEYAPEVPLVMAFSDQLSQVWTNLLQNAVQALNNKGRIAIRVASHNQGVQVSIEDNGPGIPPDIQQRIFEPFFTTKKRGEGTGLGLDIVRKIVQRHQGTISLESQPGRTCFTVWIPVQA